MPTVELEQSLAEVMGKLGCKPELINAAVEAALTAEYDVNGVMIKTTGQTPLSGQSGVTQQYAPVKFTVLQLILNDKLPGDAAKNMAQINMTKAVSLVLTSTTVKVAKPSDIGSAKILPDELGDVFDGGKISKQVMADQEKKNVDISHIFKKEAPVPQTEPAPKEIKSGFAKDPDFQAKVTSNVEKVAQQIEKDVLEGTAPPGAKPIGIMGSAKVKLATATKLYQPIAGSDAESTYFCIALGQDINLAVRIKTGNQVSLRVEGPNIGEHKAALKKIGMGDSGGYCSLHLKAENPELARKSVGAMLFGIGYMFKQVATDLNPIWGKGA